VFYLKKGSSKSKIEEPFLYKLSDSEKALLQEGDIILRRGYGFVSTMILNLMDEDFEVTHIGILVEKDDELNVAHSLSSSVSNQNGIQLQSLDSFVNHSHKNTILITRIKQIDKNKQDKIANNVRYYLKKKIAFDHSFDYKDTTKFYCSELVWRIYEHNLNLLQLPDSIMPKTKYNSLKTFYNPEYFDIILNHQQ
jgi:predicted RNA binding protein with dsRBD fold (UPF0201 family)